VYRVQLLIGQLTSNINASAMDMMEDLMAETGMDGSGIVSSYPNMSNSLDNRYGLCNISRHASLPFCANRSSGVDEFRPDYSHGFAMQRIISIVV
jgi:hypothetical protein